MWLKAKARAVSHKANWVVARRAPGLAPLVFVLGYPKSGTTWACQLVADYLELPFPRFNLLPTLCPAVVHGHEGVDRSFPRGAYIMRDGRDALVSLYFHLARYVPEGDHPQLTRAQRRLFPGLVNKDRVRENLPPFLEGQFRKPHATRLHWGRHVCSCFDAAHPRFGVLRYEGLLSDGPNELARAMEAVAGEPPDIDRASRSIERFSFQRQAGRKRGAEDRSSFLRKGGSGDWTNHFTPEAAQIFDRYCGEALVRAGYEADRDWIARVGEGECGKTSAQAAGASQ